MIYTVEAALDGDESEIEWELWYHHMKPPHVILTVPGVHSAQRFESVSIRPKQYFAIYGVESLEVMESAAYRQAGGGRFQTETWMPRISLWNRDLVDGFSEAPQVPLDRYLVVADGDEPVESPHGIPFQWGRTVALDRSTRWRGFAVLKPDALAMVQPRISEKFRLFRPRTVIHYPVA